MKFSRLNLAAMLARHVVGHNHGAGHRMLCGTVLGVFGVGVAQAGHLSDIHAVGFVADLFGYAFHGMALVPFLEHMAEVA